MKSRNRWVGVVLSFVMMVNLLVFLQKDVLVQGGQDVIQCQIPVLSNEYEGSQVNIYAKENRFYLSVDDIADFTRCSIEEETSKISLTQGVRKIVIEKKTGHMYDFGSVDQGEVLFFEQDGTYFYEAIPMLTYLGASCEVGEGNVLEIYMPMYTIWEAIMPEYEKLLFDMEVIHGGESDLKGNLICAMISDILDVRKGHGIFANGNTYIEDALHEVLKLDMMQYSLVQAEVAKQNQAVNTFLSSERVQNYLNQQEKLEEAVRNLVKKYISICKETKSEEAFDDFRKLYDETVKELGIKDEKKLGNYIKAGSLFCDIVKTSQEIMAYDEAAKTLFARTINDEILAYAGYQDIMWSENAKKLSKELESNQSIVASATIDKLIDATLDEVKDKGVEYALSKFVLKENIYATTLELAGYIASIVNSDLHEAFYSERSAVYLNMIQYDAIKLLDGLLLNCKENEQFSNEKTLENIKSVLELYYRASAAFSAHMAKSVEQFGEGNNAEASRYFKEDVGNVAALYLYRVVNCKVVPIREYQTLVEEVDGAKVVEFLTTHFEEEVSKQELVQEYLEKSDEYLKAGNCVAAVEILMEGQKYVDSSILNEREKYLRENIVLVQSVKKEFDEEGTYSGEYRYEYDLDGRCIKEERYDADKECKWKYEYSYDKQGRKIRETRLIREKSGWDYSSVSYEYDSQGRYTAIRYGNTFEIETEFVWEYDINGNEIMHSYYDYRNSKLIYKQIYEYDYDKFNNPVNVYAYDYEEKDDSYNLWWTGVYVYNEEGNLEEFLRYDGNSNIEWCYKYDKLGNVCKEIYYDEKGEINSQEEYVYNEFYDIVMELRYDREKNIITKEETTYNEHGNCVKKVLYDAQGTIAHFSEYHYDLFQNKVLYQEGDLNKVSVIKYNNIYKFIGSNIYESTMSQNSFKPNSLYGVWESEDKEMYIIFEKSTDFSMLAAMENIMPEGKIKIVDIENATVLRGEYVTEESKLHILFSGLEFVSYDFSFKDEIVTIENKRFCWKDKVENCLVGTWINDELQITFDENNNVEQKGTQNREGVYIVLSATEVCINLEGQAYIYEYIVEDGDLKINGMLLNKKR